VGAGLLLISMVNLLAYRHVQAIFDKMLTTVQNRFTAMGLPAFPAAHLLIFWESIQLGYSGFKHNPADYATAIRVPTLMLHGANDPRATVAQGAKVFKRLNGPKQMGTFADVGHDSYFAVQPEQWTQAITSFLAQPSGAQPRHEAV
jgi:hypothetical protein